MKLTRQFRSADVVCGSPAALQSTQYMNSSRCNLNSTSGRGGQRVSWLLLHVTTPVQPRAGASGYPVTQKS